MKKQILIVITLLSAFLLGACSLEGTLQKAATVADKTVDVAKTLAKEELNTEKKHMCESALSLFVNGIRNKSGLALVQATGKSSENIKSASEKITEFERFPAYAHENSKELAEQNKIIINEILDRVLDDQIEMDYDSIKDFKLGIREMYSVANAYGEATGVLVNNGKAYEVIIQFWDTPTMGGLNYTVLQSIDVIK